MFGALHEQREDRERRHERGQVEVPLVPEDPEMIERPDERHGDEEEEREIREVVQRGVVDHRPVIERRVEVIGRVAEARVRHVHALTVYALRVFQPRARAREA